MIVNFLKEIQTYFIQNFNINSLQLMGNYCGLCYVNTSDAYSESTIEQLEFAGSFYKMQESFSLPPISQQISDLLSIRRPFNKQLNEIKKSRKIQYQGDIYIGETSRLRVPNGWGKMYCKNGEIIIGEFQNGVPNGKCFYVKADGTYHQGEIVDRKLNCQQGIYYSNQFEYIGGFKENVFHGEGRILKKDYVIQGRFEEGKIQSGRLQWKQSKNKCYTYNGRFNELMEMHGEGILEEPQGTYKGQFKNNQKSGKGQYLFKGGAKYIGEYSEGKKWGYGQLHSKFRQLIYRGPWIDDLPVNLDQSKIKEVQLNSCTSQRKFQRSDTIRSTIKSFSQ